MEIDRVVLASDYSPQFLNFWPLAATSWKKVFGISPTLALISKDVIEGSVLSQLTEFGEVIHHVSSSEAPIPNQAKMFRWFVASKFGTSVTTIEDIDTIFLTPDYLLKKLISFEPDKLLGIGSDVDQNNISYTGKFPASNLTGTGEIFSRFFESYETETFESFLDRFKGLNLIDAREDPFNKPSDFSDESLIRALRQERTKDLIKTIPRDVDIQTSWMDRSWWPKDGVIPAGAILANMPRPLYNNFDKCEKLVELHFPIEYPWIFPRRSRFWENPDSPARTNLQLICYRVKKLKKFKRVMFGEKSEKNA
jgi:hypothetical protein